MTVTAKYLPASVDIEFVMGDDVSLTFTIYNRNLGGGTGEAEIRVKESSTSTLINTLTVGLTDSGDNTEVVVTLADSSNLGPAGKYYWDLAITDSGEVRTYMAGRATIHPDVTA